MSRAPIIHSLLDTDLYKFTMLQVVLHQFPQAHGVYEFRCRNNADTVYPLAEIKSDLEAELDALCTLKFTQDELDYLRGLRFIKSDFVDYLELFQLKRRFVTVTTDEAGRLHIRVEGPMIQAMFFEIYILAIVNELYFRRLETPEVLAEGERRLQEKAARLKIFAGSQNPEDPPFLVSDFGTRRRYNLKWQEHVIRTFHQAAPEIFRGTSNVYLAKKLGLTPIGTMAHEFLQAFQALDVRLRNFQTAALEAWVHEYRGDLGIALTDVVGMDAFLRDFDLYFAKLFDGLRHDSGDPYEWGDKAYAHYKKLKIDSRTKMLTFSDGLDIQRPFQNQLRYRHQPHQRPRPHAAEHSLETGGMQRPVRRQTVRQPGQNHDRQRYLPGLPAPNLPNTRTEINGRPSETHFSDGLSWSATS